VACFAGGSFLLGGLVLDEQKYIDFGLQLVAGCHETYTATATGIGPEIFNWLPSTCNSSSTSPDCTIPSKYADQAAFYNSSGFWISDSTYDLRPEVLESIYYAYRITGNPMYQDWAWSAFLAINSTCRFGSGFSQISNVNMAGGRGSDNNQESFFFAEVMKYAYLIHAPDGPWQVNYNGRNDFVFNTEAHPLKAANKI
jgi:mannosyl-oligosaccharide alpha-1,2-mannosidase